MRFGWMLAVWLLAPAFADPYAAVDRHALAATARDERDIPSLAAYLKRGTERETARAVYRWCAERIDYDDRFTRNGRDAPAVLHDRKAVCLGYSTLYAALAKEAGLKAVVVHGWGETWGHGGGRHAWNAVEVNGRWLLADVTWSTDRLSENCFLQPPETFVFTHFPFVGQEYYGPIVLPALRVLDWWAIERAFWLSYALPPVAVSLAAPRVLTSWRHRQAGEFYARAWQKESRDDREGAEQDYSAAIAYNRYYADAYVERGRLRLVRNDLPGARQDCALALTLEPRGARVAALSSALQTNPHKAQAERQRAARLDRRKASDFYVKLAGDRRLSLPEAAARLYVEAAQMDPYNPAALEGRGWAREQRGNWVGALADYDGALLRKHGLAGASTGRERVIQQMLGEARKTSNHRRVLELCDAVLHSERGNSVAHCQRGVALAGLGRTDDALKAFDESVMLDGDVAETWLARAHLFQQLGWSADALRDATTAIELDSNCGGAYLCRGQARLELGQWGAAATDLERATALLPERSTAHAARGRALAQLGEHELALDSCDRAVRLAPGDGAAYLARAEVLLAALQGQGALVDLQKAEELGADPAKVKRLRASLDLAGLEEAEAPARSVVVDPRAVDALGRGLRAEKHGSRATALALFRTSAELGSPEGAAARDRLLAEVDRLHGRGREREDASDLEGALAAYEEALKAGGDATVRAKRDRLRRKLRARPSP